MMLKVEAIIWRTALDSLEIELERKLTERQRQSILLGIRKIIWSFIRERYILDILILRPFNVIGAFYRFADDEQRCEKAIIEHVETICSRNSEIP